MRVRLAIVHWMPVEMYPPLMNLVRCLAESGRFEVVLHTTESPRSSEAYVRAGVAIRRSPAVAGRGWLGKLRHYLWFNLGTAARLLGWRPQVVVYIEPASAFPVWVHSLLRPGVPLFIHHHEYHSPDQFLRPGMRLVRMFHGLERRRLFGRAAWISHTNAKRLEMFAGDCPMVPQQVLRVFPNFPPGAWRRLTNRAWDDAGGTFRFVYVGSLSLRDTFLEAFVHWILARPARSVRFDVYAYNLDAETREFLLKHECDALRYFPEGVGYEQLPEVLGGYHAGVILYRAETLNYRFNETNKLFEYLICGLDVWYSDRMEGVKPHRRIDQRPRVLECDFERMGERDWSEFLALPAKPATAPPVGDAETAVAVFQEAVLAAVNASSGQ